MSAITCEWGLEKQQDTNGAEAQNKSQGVVTSICAASLALKKKEIRQKIPESAFFCLVVCVCVCVGVDVITSSETLSLLLYGVCRNVA